MNTLSASTDEAPQSPGELRLERVTSWEQLEAHGEAWERLGASLPELSLFSRFAFNRAVWRTWGGESPCTSLLLWEGERLVGIFPLERRHWHAYGLPIREIGYLRSSHSLCNALLLSGDRSEGLAALMAALRDDQGWDSLLLENVQAPEPLLVPVSDAARAHGLPADHWVPGRRLCYLSVTGSYDDYLATRSRNFRWQLKKFRRIAEEMGTLRFECLSEPEAIRGALPELFDLEQRSWQAADRATGSVEADHSFHRLLLDTLPPRQAGELWLLRIDGGLAATLRMLRHDDVLAVHTMHYDKAYAKASPGTLLFERMLASAWERGLAEVDFHGDTPFFRRWTQQARQLHNLRIYAPGAYGRFLRLARRMGRNLASRARGERPGDG